MDLAAIPPPVLAVALACRDHQEPQIDEGWLVKADYLVYLSTFHVVERATGAVRQGVLSLQRQQSAAGEREYQTVAFSIGGKTRRVYLGRA